jgi:hypothetical protein
MRDRQTGADGRRRLFEQMAAPRVARGVRLCAARIRTTAFAGLAERVRVDPLLGQATTRIPIELPPGRRVTPELALTYASGGGNGLVGRGWDLRWPRVERSTQLGVPVDPDDPSHAYLPPDSAEFVLVLPSGTIALDRYLGAAPGENPSLRIQG